MLKALRTWNKYKYRFVPWIANNINEITPRVIVPKECQDELSNEEITHRLQSLFKKFIAGDKIRPRMSMQDDFYFNMGACLETIGFTVEKEPSQLEDGGNGVIVSTGRVKKGDLVAIYPGLVYQPWEPVLLVSVANAYLFRCADGVHIDGCNRGMSRGLYLSCARRDRQMGEWVCDVNWLDDMPLNPLAIGQYVNNQTPEFPANVAYQEYEIPANFPWKYRRFIPNIEARTMNDRSLEEFSSDRLLKTIVLVALRDIEVGEELFSSYYTLVYGDEEEEEEEELEDTKQQQQKIDKSKTADRKNPKRETAL